MKITLIELPPTLNGKLFEKPAKDVYSIFYLPSRAIDLLHGILDSKGYKDVVTINPRFNKRKEIITKKQLKRVFESDIIGISAITRTIPQSYELATIIKKEKPNIKIIFGGPHTTSLPEEALKYADYIVRNEGDVTFPILIDKISENFEHPNVDDVKGISYKNSKGKYINNPQREFITSEQLSDLPFPVFSQDALDKINCFTINSSRGCPFNCDFCSVIVNFGPSYRFMSEDKAIELMKYIASIKKEKTAIFFGDDNFVGNISRTKNLLKRMIDEKIGIKKWAAQVRVESSKDKELLSLMKKAGCYNVFIGFESIDENTLKAWNKKSSLNKIKQAIREYHKAGISIHGMFVFGSEYDTLETVNRTVKFANEQGIDTVQFFIITPLPGTPLTKRYEEANKILSKKWDLYNAQQVVIIPENMTPYELQKSIMRAYRKFYNIPQAIKKLFSGIRNRENFILRLEGLYLRFKVNKEIKYYIKSLKKIDKISDKLKANFENWLEDIKTSLNNIDKIDVNDFIWYEFNKFTKSISKIGKKFEKIDNEYRQLFKQMKSYIIEEIKQRFKKEIKTILGSVQ